MNRGEVWWADHPDTGPRPYLIMTRQAVIPMLRRITAVPATTRVRGIPSEVPLDENDGMARACVLNFDSMVVMPKSWLVEPICQLSPVRMVQACRALSVALGC